MCIAEALEVHVSTAGDLGIGHQNALTSKTISYVTLDEVFCHCKQVRQYCCCRCGALPCNVLFTEACSRGARVWGKTPVTTHRKQLQMTLPFSLSSHIRVILCLRIHLPCMANLLSICITVLLGNCDFVLTSDFVAFLYMLFIFRTVENENRFSCF